MISISYKYDKLSRDKFSKIYDVSITTTITVEKTSDNINVISVSDDNYNIDDVALALINSKIEEYESNRK